MPEFDVPQAKLPEVIDGGPPNVPPGWRPTPAEPVPVVRCVAIRADGSRCRRWSLRGTTVCLSHGGRLPNVVKHAAAVVEGAKLRIIGLTDLAIDTMEDLAVHAENEAVRQRAAADLLDRAGVKTGLEVNVSVEQVESPAQKVQARLQTLSSRLLAPAPELTTPDEEPLDVEVVDTDELLAD